MKDKIKKILNGFTTLEIIVIFAVGAVIVGTVLVGFPSFNNTVLLKNVGFDVALTIREAQSLASGTAVEVNSDTFDTGYGVKFGPVSFSTSTLSSFILFADTNNDNDYDSASDTVVKNISLKESFVIDSICVFDAGTVCYPQDSSLDIEFSVVFPKDNLEPIISFYLPTFPLGPFQTSFIEIFILSNRGDNPRRVKVIVNPAGRIEVDDCDGLPNGCIISSGCS